MTRAHLDELHRLLDRYEDTAATSLTSNDEYELRMSNLRLAVIAHVEQIEGYARRTARRRAA